MLDRQSNIRLWQIILAGLTTAGFVGAAFGKGPVAALLGLVVSTELLVLNSYVKEYNLG
jgi:hypothetical protein